MPNAAAQKINAMPASRRSRPPESDCSCRSRASALRHLGVSTVQRRGRTAVGETTRSGVENGVELMIPHAAGELEKEILQPHILGCGLLLDFSHGAVGDDLAPVDDGDPITHGLGYLE